MKRSVKMIALSAVLVSALFACTKEAKESQVNIQEGTLTAVKEKAVEKVSKKPLLIPGQSPGIASVGKQVTVSYTATDQATNAAISCGKLTIYQWDGTLWIEVAVANAPTASFTFTPTTATDCAYKFRAGFSPGRGSAGVSCSGDYTGVDYTTEQDFCVDVQECVETFTITSDVEATAVANGQYEFAITYTLISPVDVNDVKFQGGATAGGNFGSTITEFGNTTVVNANNNNTVLKWEGNLQACTPQKVTFKYKRNFNCTGIEQAITGGWKASAGATELDVKAPLTFSCN
jgi:hypothetical protein